MLQRSNGAAQHQSVPRRVHVTIITSLHETTPNHSFSNRLLRVILALVSSKADFVDRYEWKFQKDRHDL